MTHHFPAPALVPFVVVLLGIAVLPLAVPHWWEKNRNKAIFCASIAAPTAAWLASIDVKILEHALAEYASFIVLLASLYVVAGNVVLRGEPKPTPWTNGALLGGGAILASLVGTTGASMLLIRPLLRANRERSSVRHVPIFFIFIVSNAGGLLTPLGDPPLFLGFMRGVPFTWTLELAGPWLLVNGLLIALFLIFDWRGFRSEGAQPPIERQPVTLAGQHNLLFLLIVVLAAARLPVLWREVVMISAAAGAIVTTTPELRAENGFTPSPIFEVAILFAAIFVTMQPALGLLEENGPELGLVTPAHFFWVTGALSSVLDNAPTYLTFFTVAQSLPANGVPTVAATGVPEPLLEAISLGAVLMGANTYIGNGPNFMVKAICDEAGFTTPSFFGYLAWSLPILLPVFGVVTLVFL